MAWTWLPAGHHCSVGSAELGRLAYRESKVWPPRFMQSGNQGVAMAIRRSRLVKQVIALVGLLWPIYLACVWTYDWYRVKISYAGSGNDVVHCVAFSPDGTTLGSGGG